MKTTTTLAITCALTAGAVLSPLLLSKADEQTKKTEPVQQRAGAPDLLAPDIRVLLAEPPAPLVPKGTKMTEEIKKAIALIHTKLMDPIRANANQRLLMSRIEVRMDTEYHFAITDTSESLFPFDVYERHLRDGWKKIASGVCSSGMESVKVAMPETGVMVEPAKHPLFALAFIKFRELEGAAAPQEEKAG